MDKNEAISLKTGDQVRLISGGPVMTVESFSMSTWKANVVWFANDILQRSEIRFSLLEKADKTIP